jgi:ferritin-like metal-binding protein YciE
MLERLNTPEELYQHKLGAALNMEQTVLNMLDDNAEEAQDEQLKQLLRHHQDETREQIANLERAFQSFGWDVDETANVAFKAFDKQAKAEVKMADDSLDDDLIVAGAAETEHHEIAVYEWLITNAKAMGRDDVAQLLQQNCDQEQHTLEEVRTATERIASATIAQAG